MKFVLALAAVAASLAANAQYVDANTARYLAAQEEARAVHNADAAQRSAEALESLARSARQAR